MSPVRIQRKRTKGWRKPPGSVYVGRGSRWGNPWAVEEDTTPGRTVFTVRSRHNDVSLGTFLTKAEAQRWACAGFRSESAPALDVTPLRGKDLACWCKLTDPCHADVLLELANATALEAAS